MLARDDLLDDREFDAVGQVSPERRPLVVFRIGAALDDDFEPAVELPDLLVGRLAIARDERLLDPLGPQVRDRPVALRRAVTVGVTDNLDGKPFPRHKAPDLFRLRRIVEL